MPSEAADAGAIAGHDVVISGTYAAGRDIVINHQTIQALTAPTVRPSELPAPVADFVNRSDVTDRLCETIESALGAGRGLTATVCGPPGIGKTALALEVAHRIDERFDSGSLFVDLSGDKEIALQPVAVLGELLFGLGVSTVPDALDDRGRLYRSTLAQGRYLVVLDNARDEQQLRPLLPGAGAWLALVTSRRRLIVPECDETVALEAFDERFGVELLAAVAGEERVGGQAAEARRIVASCGGLPLAVRIAAARLARRPHWRLSKLAELLADERRRLGELDMGDAEVRAGFLLTYQGEEEEARRLLRLLGLLDVPDFAPWVPAALLEVDPDDADELAAQLCEAHLLQVIESGSERPRYRFHDLLRAFARERLDDETDEQERAAALRRVLGVYFGLALAADAGFSAANSAVWDRPPDEPDIPEPDSRMAAEDPLGWFSVERASLLRLIDQAHKAEEWSWAWRLASAMWQFLEVTARWTDWSTAYGLALDAARRAGDRRAESSCLRLLGRLDLARGDVDAAAERFEEALGLSDALDDLHGECMVRKDLSVVERLRNRHTRSSELLLSALDGFRRLDETYWIAVIRRELGIEYRYLAQWQDAATHLREAVTAFGEMGEALQEAQTWFELAVLMRQQGEWAEAADCLERAAPAIERLDARGLRTWALRESALVAAGRGDLDAAVDQLSRCLESWQELDDPLQYAITLHELALVHQQRGETDRAIEVCRRAIDTFGEDGRLYEARALVTLAVLSAARGDLEDAVSTAERALPMLRDNEDLVWEIKAQRTLADAHGSLGNEPARRDATVLAEGLARYAGAEVETRF